MKAKVTALNKDYLVEFKNDADFLTFVTNFNDKIKDVEIIEEDKLPELEKPVDVAKPSLSDGWKTLEKSAFVDKEKGVDKKGPQLGGKYTEFKYEADKNLENATDDKVSEPESDSPALKGEEPKVADVEATAKEAEVEVKDSPKTDALKAEEPKSEEHDSKTPEEHKEWHEEHPEHEHSEEKKEEPAEEKSEDKEEKKEEITEGLVSKGSDLVKRVMSLVKYLIEKGLVKGTMIYTVKLAEKKLKEAKTDEMKKEVAETIMDIISTMDDNYPYHARKEVNKLCDMIDELDKEEKKEVEESYEAELNEVLEAAGVEPSEEKTLEDKILDASNYGKISADELSAVDSNVPYQELEDKAMELGLQVEGSPEE